MDSLSNAFAAQMTGAVNATSTLLSKLSGGGKVDVSITCLLVSAVLCYAPHFLKAKRVMDAAQYIPKEENPSGVAYQLKQPRVSLDLAMKHAPASLRMAIARAQGCHANMLETYPFIATAVLCAKVAGVDSVKVDAAALSYVGFRALYFGLYCWGTKGWMAYMRSTVWFNALLSCSWLMLQAATNGGGKKTDKAGFW